ncbi:MAG: hypothetical protein B6U88_00660 [Candidatus Aenigmarchaeota archaeon ex4484_56]|nr:MAG: hypothetical protein B6U88_00660 [Candidatus Aenigmarchaeota archaeon ex4484_56]
MTKEREITLDISKLKKYRVIFTFLILLFVFYASLSLRLETVDEKYLLASDPHFWYRMTKYIVDDNIPEYDMLRLSPDGSIYAPGLFPYIAAYSYGIANFLTGIEFYRFLFWFSAIVAALCVFPAFWIGKELHSDIAGLFIAFFIGITPSFLSRSMAGFFDTDCTNMLFTLLTIALFISAYNRAELINKKNLFIKSKPIILSIFASVSLSAFAFIWPGFAYIPWLFVGLFIFHWLYIIFKSEGHTISVKIKKSLSFFKPHLLVYLTIFSVFLLVCYPFSGFGKTENIISVLSFFQKGKAEGGIFPNVWVSISEEMSASFTEIISRVGTGIFIFGIIGLILLGVLFLLNINKKKTIYPETFFFMLIWTIPTLYGALWAVRFSQQLVVPLSICAGIGFGILYDLCFKLKGRLRMISLIGLVIISLITLNSVYSPAKAMASHYGTGISKNWEDAMNWLKNNTPECTVVATYWDPGYWIATLSERKVIFDGSSQNSVRYTKLEDLNGLDCVEDRHGYITEKDGIKYCVTSRIQDMAGVLYTSNETWAAKVLETYIGNCSELYELASSDLIGKSHWWTYFSNWDPEKGKGQAYDYIMVNLQKQENLLFENGTSLIYGPFILKITSKNNTQIVEPYAMGQDKLYHKIKSLVIYQNNTPYKLEFENYTIDGTLWIDPTFRYAIYMRPQTENSLFTRMFFYNGEGLKYFEPAYTNSEVKLYRFKVGEFRKDLEEGRI